MQQCRRLTGWWFQGSNSEWMWRPSLLGGLLVHGCIRPSCMPINSARVFFSSSNMEDTKCPCEAAAACGAVTSSSTLCFCRIVFSFLFVARRHGYPSNIAAPLTLAVCVDAAHIEPGVDGNNSSCPEISEFRLRVKQALFHQDVGVWFLSVFRWLNSL